MWAPVRDLKLVEIIDKDVIIGYRLEYRRQGPVEGWEIAPTVREYVKNDREDNHISPSLQRSVCKEDPSVS
jgi:hypothetical protein